MITIKIPYIPEAAVQYNSYMYNVGVICYSHTRFYFLTSNTYILLSRLT